MAHHWSTRYVQNHKKNKHAMMQIQNAVLSTIVMEHTCVSRAKMPGPVYWVVLTLNANSKAVAAFTLGHVWYKKYTHQKINNQKLVSWSLFTCKLDKEKSNLRYPSIEEFT